MKLKHFSLAFLFTALFVAPVVAEDAADTTEQNADEADEACATCKKASCATCDDHASEEATEETAQ